MQQYGRKARAAHEELVLRGAEDDDDHEPTGSRRARAGHGRSARLTHFVVVLTITVLLAVFAADWWIPRSPGRQSALATADARLAQTETAALATARAYPAALDPYPGP